MAPLPLPAANACGRSKLRPQPWKPAPGAFVALDSGTSVESSSIERPYNEKCQRELVMAAKKTNKKYGSKASQKVERAMHELKRGKLKSAKSGKKVKSRKQAIAIGLSEARREGGKVPAKPGS